jgi:hypothetical protein
VVKNISLTIISIVISLLLAEGMVRIAIDSDDFLNPQLVRHPQFKTMISPNSAGHDRWGFRNDSIPQKVELLTVGDSFTYGYLTPKKSNWPSIVGRQAGLTVYNVSMGAWGPSQYLCAMKVYAAALKPKYIAIAVYLGNDIDQAAMEDYPCDELNPDRISAGSEVHVESDGRPLEGIRTWLSHHSLLYQLIKTGFTESAWFAKLSVFRRQDFFVHSSAGTTVALRVHRQEDVHFQRKVALLIERLAQIKRGCERIAEICFAVLIPSKEGIYYPLMSNSVPSNVASALEQVWRNEQFASNAIAAAFPDMLIVNSGRDLQNTIRAGNSIFPVSADSHFNSKGHEVIGALVSAQMKAQLVGNPQAAAR